MERRDRDWDGEDRDWDDEDRDRDRDEDRDRDRSRDGDRASGDSIIILFASKIVKCCSVINEFVRQRAEAC